MSERMNKRMPGLRGLTPDGSEPRAFPPCLLPPLRPSCKHLCRSALATGGQGDLQWLQRARRAGVPSPGELPGAQGGAGEGKGPDSPGVSRRKHPSPHLDFSPVKPMLDFQLRALEDNMFA